MLSGRSVLLVEHNGSKAFLKSYLNLYAYGISPDILPYKRRKPLESKFFRIILLSGQLKPKPFGVFMSIDIVVSVKSLLTETTLTIDNKYA